MSTFALVVTLVCVLIAGAIIAFDVATDSGFSHHPMQREPLMVPSQFVAIQLEEEHFRCKELHHSSRNVWCPNPSCPDYEDDIPTDEFSLE